MELTSSIPGILLVIWALALGAIVSLISPFYLSETARDGSRYEAVDGLRGYLAFGVFLAHAALFNQWYRTGIWGWQGQDAGIYGLTGRYGVALFFEITGFLFWGKVFRAQGQVDWLGLYSSRVRRLVPLYLFAVCAVFAVVAIKTEMELRVSVRTLAQQVGSWLTFSLIEPMNINGLRSTERINAGVLWTLAYEWVFYICLPFLSIFLSSRRFAILFAGTFLLIYLKLASLITIHFLFGMIAAIIVHDGRWKATLTRPIAAVIGIGILTLLFTQSSRLPRFGEAGLLFAIFLLVAHGNSFFGLLHLRASRYLGSVSYSLYLLHGTFLYVSLAFVNRVTAIAEMPPDRYWALIAAITVILIVGCGLTYRCIEHPFIRRRNAPGKQPLSMRQMRAGVTPNL